MDGARIPSSTGDQFICSPNVAKMRLQAMLKRAVTKHYEASCQLTPVVCTFGQDLQREFRQWVEQQVSSNKLAFTARGPGSASAQPIRAAEQHAAEAVVQENRKATVA